MGLPGQNQPDLRSEIKPNLSNQSGQAVVEYILILVVTVGIILGGLYQLNTAFKAWAQNYFGSYLSCLLETGELPALGGAFMSDAGICNELYEPFSIENGRPLLTSTGGGSGSSSGSGTAAAQAKQSEAADAAKDGSGQGQREGSGSSSGSSQINPSSRFSASRSSSGSASNPPIRRGSSDSYTGSTEGSIPSSLLGDGTSSRIRMRPSDGSTGYSIERQQERKPITSNNEGTRKADELAERGRKKSAPFRAPAAKTQEKEESGMTFGSFLRYLVIAAIIIALILVIGGQLLQISKSSE